MDPITGLAAYKAIQAVTGITRDVVAPETTDSTETAPSADGGFEKIMKQFLSPDAANNVNEEELFAAVVQKRLMDKDEALATKYGELLAEHKSSMARPDGYVSVEKAAKAALRDLVEAGDITVEDGDKIYSEAFAASQLDDNADALFDSRGSTEDATVAVDSLESALAAAQSMIEKYESGEEVAPERSLEEGESSGSGTVKSGDIEGGTKTPTGNTFDGAEGFLWKPESESDGNLVVLLPSEFNDLVSSVVLTHEDKVLDEGRFAGNEHNGSRGHYRFGKSGGDYPDGLKVEVRFDDGTIVKYDIPKTSERYD
ncbi:MAG: hypothetical protein KDD56_01120 [Bdellovibrionales bacterium]|nr:hypothetical protein [Bdellovibrionales bacterium]